MPPRRGASGSPLPAQRRSRAPQACKFCRIVKQRCNPIKYGDTDRTCRRCNSLGLDCDLPRDTHSQSRSQSPSAGPSIQGPGPIGYAGPPQPAGGATGEQTRGSRNDAQYTLPQFESAPTPMAPFPTHSEEQHGSTANIPSSGQDRLQMSDFLPLVPGMDIYQQSFPNVAEGPSNLVPGYYRYYGQPTQPQRSYVANYATESASDGDPDLTLSYVAEGPQPGEEPEPGNAGASANEQITGFFRTGES